MNTHITNRGFDGEKLSQEIERDHKDVRMNHLFNLPAPPTPLDKEQFKIGEMNAIGDFVEKVSLCEACNGDGVLDERHGFMYGPVVCPICNGKTKEAAK